MDIYDTSMSLRISVGALVMPTVTGATGPVLRAVPVLRVQCMASVQYLYLFAHETKMQGERCSTVVAARLLPTASRSDRNELSLSLAIGSGSQGHETQNDIMSTPHQKLC